ncbi:uncharacterized protein N7459_010041 [Penicillium hispanicum]|uniref:uncharacterized protein n=1 Tax=Penicillium hispanicum TaxID=1080232 RepID=UPI0025417B8C|nr:uncharacterized protein N7459_010041 [Penicillium hispanicum]KAJ5570611.1 hypothetical protein N7459_010041 [Penicillium hispanicum]
MARCEPSAGHVQAEKPPARLPERSSPSGISILIAGAGVAGLMASLECWRQGHEVRVIERSATRLLSGDSFSIGPTAIRAVQHWPDMIEENERLSTNLVVSWHKITGETITGPSLVKFHPAKSSAGGDADAPEPPSKIHRHSRPKFHKMLSDQLDRVGIHVEYGKRVVEYYEDASTAKAGVILEGGEKMEADVVIAADGVGSKSSRITMGHEIPARPTGFSIYRTAFPVELATADPMIRERFPMPDEGITSGEIWMGDNIHAMFGRSQDEMTWAINYPDSRDDAESWSTLVDPETVLKTTATIPGWPEIANRIIQATPKDHLLDFRLKWREPQPCWVSPGGRVVQIGDAAHTFLPSSGNGATQGIEDAMSLSTCLKIAGRENIPWATRVHNKLRFERVSCFQKVGVLNHEARNRSANANASQAKIVGLTGAWIWRHNPEQYAMENYHQALSHLSDGTAFQNTNIPPGHVYRPWTIGELLKLKDNGQEIELDGEWD